MSFPCACATASGKTPWLRSTTVTACVRSSSRCSAWSKRQAFMVVVGAFAERLMAADAAMSVVAEVVGWGGSGQQLLRAAEAAVLLCV